MILLEGSIAMFGIVMILGLAGFVAMLFVMLGRAFSWIVRTAFGAEAPGDTMPVTMSLFDDEGRPVGRICHGLNCGHISPSQARFCARCGRRLDLPTARNPDVDSYG